MVEEWCHMDVKEAIRIRRSIRTYEDRGVPPDVVAELLDAARLAPSGCNAQPWRFFVVRDRQTVETLRAQKAFQQAFVYSAPVIIVCCGDPRTYAGKHGADYQVAEGSVPEDAEARQEMFSIVEGKQMVRTVRDVSIASAFMVLRATELGLGTSYIGLINEAVLRTVLGIPEDLVIPYVVTVGYTPEIPPSRPRKELDDLVLG
jgi:nitroreductase